MICEGQGDQRSQEEALGAEVSLSEAMGAAEETGRCPAKTAASAARAAKKTAAEVERQAEDDREDQRVDEL